MADEPTGPPPRCLWPDCPEGVRDDRAFCYRHFARLPDKIRRWVGAVFDRSELRTSGSSTQRAIGAARSWAKKNPDPHLPPFRKGNTVIGRAGTIFDVPYVVETCVLSDAGVWLVVLAGGEVLPAKELQPYYHPGTGA